MIGSPIAFDHIQAKVNKRGYKDVDEFKADVNLIFSNAMTYNEEESQIWQDAFAMRVRSFFFAFLLPSLDQN